MKRLYSKDLGIIFLLTAVYIILTSFPNFNEKYLMDTVFFVLFFLFTGYSLIALIRPKEDYKDILRKPVLLLEFSVLLTLAVSIILRFSYLGLKLRYLVMVLSIIIMVMSITAYIRRINHYNSMKQRERPEYIDEVSDSIKKLTKSSVEPSENQDEKPVIKAESNVRDIEKLSPTIEHEVELEKDKLVVTEDSIREKYVKQVPEVEKPLKTSKPKTGQAKLLIDLVIIDLLSIFVLISYFVKIQMGAITYFIGLFYMLFLVGYPLVRIIFAERGSLNKKLLIGISIGLSLPITSVLGLILNSTPYGFSVKSILLPLAVLTIILSLYAYKRVGSVNS